MKTTHEIIKLFIENDIPIHIQLQSLKMAREKIEWCRKTGPEMRQKKLEL